MYQIVQCVYSILCIPKQKRYIGSTTNYKNRIKEHIRSFNKGTQTKELQEDWYSYGKESFKFDIIEIVENFNILGFRESYWIEYFKNVDNGVYNVGSVNTISDVTKLKISNSLRGRTLSLDTREKMSNSHKNKPLSNEHRQNISNSRKKTLKGVYAGENNGMYGKKHTKESREKISMSLKGNIPWNLGKYWDEETKKKISISNKGKKMSDSTKQKCREKSKQFWDNMSPEERASFVKSRRIYSDEYIFRLRLMYRQCNNIKEVSEKFNMNYEGCRLKIRNPSPDVLKMENELLQILTEEDIQCLIDGTKVARDFY